MPGAGFQYNPHTRLRPLITPPPIVCIRTSFNLQKIFDFRGQTTYVLAADQKPWGFDELPVVSVAKNMMRNAHYFNFLCNLCYFLVRHLSLFFYTCSFSFILSNISLFDTNKMRSVQGCAGSCPKNGETKRKRLASTALYHNMHWRNV